METKATDRSGEGNRSVVRILDVAINRGREAIRVIEDAVRFLIDDEAVTRSLKSLRHEFVRLTEAVPLEERLSCRDTEADVGTSVQVESEYERQSLEQVLRANFCRFQESLRSIEEFSKLVFPEVSAGIEQLRYQSYTLEKQIWQRMRQS